VCHKCLFTRGSYRQNHHREKDGASAFGFPCCHVVVVEDKFSTTLLSNIDKKVVGIGKYYFELSNKATLKK